MNQDWSKTHGYFFVKIIVLLAIIFLGQIQNKANHIDQYF